MDEREIRTLIDDVKIGRLSRRRFVQTMVGLGLTAPAGRPDAHRRRRRRAAEAPRRSRRRKRGGGGPLKVLWWQAPTLLNPHFATGTKDRTARGSSTSRWPATTPTATSSPSSPPTIPTVDNGGLGEDGTWVTWKLKKGVQWHDGKPFTADDVVFNWEYAADPATAAVDDRRLPRHRARREARRPQRQGGLQAADAVLVRGVLPEPG